MSRCGSRAVRLPRSTSGSWASTGGARSPFQSLPTTMTTPASMDPCVSSDSRVSGVSFSTRGLLNSLATAVAMAWPVVVPSW